MMKFIFVITKADEIGGAQIHVLDLCKRLKFEGHDIKIIVGENGLFVRHLKTYGLEVIIETSLVRHIDPFKDIKFICKLRRIINNEKPDIVHLHSSKAGLLGRFSCLGLDVSCLFTAHGWSFAEGIPNNKRKVYTFIEKLTSNMLDKIITVSEHDKVLALKNNISTEDKFVTIHNGVKHENIPSVNVSSSKDVNIIMVARFSEQKDHETLFNALSKLKDLSWSINLVGKGKFLPHFKNRAIDLGISSRVNFLGERDDVPQLLSQSDIFCLISNWEGFPISIIEAMQLGLPIVASDVGGVTESVKHNQNGFVVKRKDSDELADYLQNLIENETLRTEFGQKSAQFYQDNFTFNAMYDKTVKVYSDLCNKTEFNSTVSDH